MIREYTMPPSPGTLRKISPKILFKNLVLVLFLPVKMKTQITSSWTTGKNLG
jgi:hypothetical protein